MISLQSILFVLNELNRFTYLQTLWKNTIFLTVKKFMPVKLEIYLMLVMVSNYHLPSSESVCELKNYFNIRNQYNEASFLLLNVKLTEFPTLSHT